MRCLIEKVVRFPRTETVRLTGPPELDPTEPDQAKFVICNHTIDGYLLRDKDGQDILYAGGELRRLAKRP
jgi:hypothetical protein